MAKFKEKQIALELRISGKSYSQIKQVLKVSKSTLSLWLRDLPLSPNRIRELRDWNQKRIEHYRETKNKKREELLKKIYEKEQKEILPISKRDLLIGGLFLYWGEGGKTSLSNLTLSNTNPSIIKAFINWAEKCLSLDRKKIKIRLHLYLDMNIKKEMNFWSKALKINLSQFRKPYIKKSNKNSITYKNGHGHGTCNAIIGNAILTKKVLMGLEVIKNYFNGLVA